LKNNNKFRWKRTATGVSAALYLMCNNALSQDEAADNTFTLNLTNTDIQSLIATVSKQTGRNFVVDPRVKAKVTVISTDPVDADGLYEVFLSVLQVHGYSAVPAGDLIKIVPDVTAKQGPVPILGDDADSSDQLVTQVIKVINVPAAQLVPILRPMVPQQGHLAAYAATNSLIITDRSSNIQRLTAIIDRIDVPDNEEIEVVRLNHAAASEIVNTLNALQRNNLGGAQGPGAVQLVADERTNSILISGDRAARVRTRGLIAHLDTPIESGGNTRVVYLKYANAEDMVSILQGVSQGQAKVGATTDSGAAGVVQPTVPQQNGQQNAAVNNAVNPVPQQQNNAVQARSAVDSGTSNVDIQADANTNSLIITAPADEMQNILAVIRQLDIRRAQVLVEAVIAEITEDNTREFGINFLIDGRDKDVPVGYSNLGGVTDGALAIAGALDNDLPPASLGSGISLALGRFGSGEIDFGFLVRAIASDADNNILSTPSLMTLDNEEAEIVVGSNVPFVTGQQLSANNDNPFQTIERQDIGLTLKVKPQINEGNTIKMELEQEVSNVNTTALTGASDIVTSKRSIKTTVLVEDGQTLVLGGLIDDQIADVEEKVPLLGDIPILGNLFRYRSTQKTKQNLLIFLHPVIMRDSDTASQYSNSKYNSLRTQQTLYRQEKDSSLQREKPFLPDLRLFFEGSEIDSPLTRFDDREVTTESTELAGATADMAAEAVAESDLIVTPQLPSLQDAGRISASMDTDNGKPVLDLTQDEVTGTPPETAVTADVIPLQTFPPKPVEAHSAEISAETTADAEIESEQTPAADLSESAINAGDGSLVILGKKTPVRPLGLQSSISSDHEARLVEIGAVALGEGRQPVKRPLYEDAETLPASIYRPLGSIAQDAMPSMTADSSSGSMPDDAEVAIVSVKVTNKNGTPIKIGRQ
jgi:general secretion pathway protein D